MIVTNINDLKKQVFFEMINLAGRVYVLVKYSESVQLGKRGFLPEEKEKGIILVFNNKMNFEWDVSGITATLNFGSTFEKCFIPPDAISTIFSPELSAQFSVGTGKNEHVQATEDPKDESKPASERKVVKVDFHKKR